MLVDPRGISLRNIPRFPSDMLRRTRRVGVSKFTTEIALKMNVVKLSCCKLPRL